MLLQNRAGLSLDLLHFLQPPAGDKQTPGLTVVRQHLWRQEELDQRQPETFFGAAVDLLIPDLAELTHDVFEDFARSVVEEWLQSRQVGALLQNALQSFLALKRHIALLILCESETSLKCAAFLTLACRSSELLASV